jgi:hypothetical protein
MRGRTAVFGLIGIVTVVGGGWIARGCGVKAEPSAAPAARQSVELTVYAQDFGMVRELRPLRLEAGGNRLRVPEVSRLLDPHSVLLRWQGDAPGLPQLVAHSYDLGVDSGEGLLKRYLGREVELVRYGTNGREAERQRGTLMVEGNGEVVLQTDGRFYIRPEGTLVAPTGSDVVTIPQLSVQAESPAAQSATLEVAYLTRGLSWSADYVATLAPKSDTLALECWASVTNRTGADYPNARVSLMAGAPNRAVAWGSYDQTIDIRGTENTTAAYPARPPTLRGGAPMAGPPEAVGDQHAYAIKSPTTVVQERMNRLLMLASARVPVARDYSARLPGLSAWGDEYLGATPGQPARGGVQVALSFYNRAKGGLGAPLPAGAVRVYEPDRAGTLRYAGAAAIENTPRDQKLTLTLARAFDLFTEARLVKRQRLNKRTVRDQVEVVLHNEKPIATPLRVVQGFGGRWRVVGESHPHVKLDAGSAQWRVTLPAGGKTTLRYTVDLAG